MIGLREIVNSKAGKIGGFVIVLIACGVIIFESISGGSLPSAEANDRWFVDAQTLKAFKHDLRAGEIVPVKAPSGGNTGYPAELCYWTADGHVRSDPYPVLLNRYRNLPGPTFCPDCGRLVVPRNPMAVEGRKPPPTKAEYYAERANSSPSMERDDR